MSSVETPAAVVPRARRDVVRRAVVLHDVRVVDGDVGAPLVEVVHRVAAVLHDADDQPVGIREGAPRVVDEAALRLVPAASVLLRGVGVERTDVQAARAARACLQLRLAASNVAGVADRPVVLRSNCSRFLVAALLRERGDAAIT